MTFKGKQISVNAIGIMQGRLLPPVNDKIQAFPPDNWADEFPNAAAVGLDAIEWIYESWAADANPLGSSEGIAQLKQLMQTHSVIVRSVCADYFMEYPLVRATKSELAERLDKLEWLLGRCAQAGITRLVLPFVDASSIKTAAEQAGVIAALKRALPAAGHHNVELHLETDLAPNVFRDFLAHIPHPSLKVNYDSGNSAALGYNAQDEFAAYGERIGSVHIKDRLLRGTTVPLDSGAADLPAVFDGLRRLGYAGDFILQVARGEPGNEIAWAKQNRAFFEKHWPETV